MQNWLTGFVTETECLLRGTDWMFNYVRLTSMFNNSDGIHPVLLQLTNSNLEISITRGSI